MGNGNTNHFWCHEWAYSCGKLAEWTFKDLLVYVDKMVNEAVMDNGEWDVDWLIEWLPYWIVMKKLNWLFHQLMDDVNEGNSLWRAILRLGGPQKI